MKQKNKAQKTVLTVVSSELKSEMRQLEQRLEKKFATKYDLTKMEERISENTQRHSDAVLTKLDGVMGELATIR